MKEYLNGVLIFKVIFQLIIKNVDCFELNNESRRIFRKLGVLGIVLHSLMVTDMQ